MRPGFPPQVGTIDRCSHPEKSPKPATKLHRMVLPPQGSGRANQCDQNGAIAVLVCLRSFRIPFHSTEILTQRTDCQLNTKAVGESLFFASGFRPIQSRSKRWFYSLVRSKHNVE